MRYLLLALLCIAGVAEGAGKDFLNPVNVIPTTTAAATITTAPVDVRGWDNIGVQVNFGVTSPAAVGIVYVDESWDYSPINAGNWTTLSFTSQSAAWAVAATSGTPAAVFYGATPSAVFIREITQTAAPYVRLRYVPSVTGAGVTAYLNAKAL